MFSVCSEEAHCCYQWRRGRLTFCQILQSESGAAPYPNGECKFFKKQKTDLSGYRDGEIKKEDLKWQKVRVTGLAQAEIGGQAIM